MVFIGLILYRINSKHFMTANVMSVRKEFVILKSNSLVPWDHSVPGT